MSIDGLYLDMKTMLKKQIRKTRRSFLTHQGKHLIVITNLDQTLIWPSNQNHTGSLNLILTQWTLFRIRTWSNLKIL